MKVGLRELKIQLSRHVAAARAGEVIEITRHKQVVARLVGIPATQRGELGALLASGAAQWNGRKPKLPEPVVLSAAGRSLADMVIEDRG